MRLLLCAILFYVGCRQAPISCVNTDNNFRAQVNSPKRTVYGMRIGETAKAWVRTDNRGRVFVYPDSVINDGLGDDLITRCQDGSYSVRLVERRWAKPQDPSSVFEPEAIFVRVERPQ